MDEVLATLLIVGTDAAISTVVGAIIVAIAASIGWTPPGAVVTPLLIIIAWAFSLFMDAHKKARGGHDIKIGILLKLFEPLTKKGIARKARMKSPKLNKILEGFKERKLIVELKSKDGRILYHTTPKGKKLVKVFKHIMEHLEGKKVLPHVSSFYR